MLIPLIITWFVFTILVRLLKITFTHALMIATIVFLLQVGYGVTPQKIFDFIINLPGNFSQTRGR
ncbi:hypothetical protein [Calothrix sp. PCC 6303]|uniref:hypothetical protein n=1 Tax=Calothrix sp. PCC 6303 TaxID=1170562 RepID=UPI0002A054B8|nr:hypothetical protein [Calothrix sp. PCC 6303]AFY99822.1 hypothetical protein Cal6303_0754 [Calothrix sp. PCC 6303]